MISSKRRGGKNRHATFLFTGVLSLFFLLAASPAIAKIEQWDFKDPRNYQYDPKKIEVADGTARLVPVSPYRDEGREVFDRGDYVLNTQSARGGVELRSQSLYEKPGQELPYSIGAREDALLALWHFNEPSGTNILDEVARNVAKSSDTETVTGQTGFGYARLFDGVRSHIFIPHYRNFDFNRPFTLELWIRPNATVSDHPQTLISRWQTAGSQKGFALQIAMDGRLNFRVSSEGAIAISHKSETVLAPGLWTHVAAVYTGKDLRIYVNGVLDGNPTAFVGPVYETKQPIYLGALIHNRLEDFYNGVMDDVAFYSRPLTETEALTHFGNSRGLVGLWHFNERGGKLVDASGYGHHATSFDNAYEAEGKLGTALHFNGKKQYVETPVSSRFAFRNRASFEAWIKPENLPGLGQTGHIISTEGGEFSMSLAGPEGRLVATAPTLDPPEVIGRIPMTPNVWHHVAVTWGDGKLRLYVDGILDTESPYSGYLETKPTKMRIGIGSQNRGPFRGIIDEVAIYRLTRTQEEIASSAGLFHSGGIYTSPIKDAESSAHWRTLSWGEAARYGKETSKNEAGLLTLYHLNDEEGQTIRDSKGDLSATPIGTYPVPGVLGDARWFSAKGFDKILSQKNFPSLSTFTLSFWFQFASDQPDLNDRLFSIGDGHPTAYRGEDGRIHVSMIGARAIVSDALVKDTKWHHFALTADGRHLFLYIDGVLSGNSPFLSATSAQPLVLGNLKSTDTFRGAIDEFAFHNNALSRDKIFEKYLNGKMRIHFLSRSSENPDFSNVPWRNLNGVSHHGHGVGAYTAALWRLNDKKYQGESGGVIDAGRFANHGTSYGRISNVPLAASGSGAFFDGAGDYIQVADASSLKLTKGFTLSAWIKPDEVTKGVSTLIDKRYLRGAPIFSSYALEVAKGNRLSLRIGYKGGYKVFQTERDGEIAVGQWNYVSATYSGREIRLYINGKLKKIAQFREKIPYDQGSLTIGRYASGYSRFFNGAIDEVAIESRALEAEEILDLYLRLKRQAIPSSESQQMLGLERGRYFQYKALLSTEIPNATPRFHFVEIRSNTFPTDSPAISNVQSVSFADLTHFRQRLGRSSEGAVTYQLSNDGANWFYHNGRNWVIAADSAESNTAEQIEGRIHDLPETLGIGSFYFKAFLHSPTGQEPVSIDSVEMEFLPNKLTVTTPNGGEAWLVDSDQEIRWNSAGEVSKVNVEYSKDDFKKDFHVLAQNVPNNGSVTWTVPDDVGSRVKVRVFDSSDPRIHDVSDIFFRIVGAFELDSPNWNERWRVGDTQKIIWRTRGTIPEVRLEYSTDEFEQQIFPIVASVQNEGEWEWQVPDHISSSVKVRVSDAQDPLVFDNSNDTFAIIGDFEFVEPKENSRWIVGSEQEIAWTTLGTIPTVKIEYKTPEQEDWNVIVEKHLNKNRFTWKVPDDISSRIRVRISDTTDKKVMHESELFSIVGGLRLINPKGKENWTVGSKRKIAWQTIGNIEKVDLEYTTDGSGDTGWLPIERSFPNTGNYIWEIPDQVDGTIQVRVLDTADSQVAAYITDPLKVVPGFLITSPNGAEGFRIGSEAEIQWKTHGASEKVRIEYSKDNFVKDIHTIIRQASNIGAFTWVVPDDASREVRIRVTDTKNRTAHDTSDEAFRIFGNFQIRVPRGGEKLEVGSLATLEWDTLGSIEKVRIEYSHDHFNKDARLIAQSVKNEGRFTWTVPDDIGSAYTLRISDISDPETEVISDEFSIIGHFRLLNPVGGEDVIVGTQVPIRWKGSGTIPGVRIDYSEDNFEKSFQVIEESAPNTGEYQWVVPNLIGREFKIRVWDPSHPDSIDVMSYPARIVGGFRIIEPNGGEVLHVGDPYEVKWETNGTIPRVKIEFSRDHFVNNAVEITDAYENLGRYSWSVPDIPAGLYKIRVSDPRDDTVYDISNADFRVRSRFILFAPNGNEGWPIGETRIIRWQTTGSVSEVRLEYTTDNYASTTVIAESIPNTGVYEWTVPNQVSQNIKVRVSDVADSDALDTSDGAFSIEGVLDIVSPNGGEVWKVGEQRSIEWKTLGDIKSVRVEFSRDGFSSDVQTIMGSMRNSGSLSWNVPDSIGTAMQIRVVDTQDLDVSDTSDLEFQIAPAFMMLAPNGGERWHATEKREVTWMTVGSAREVDLYYTDNDFQTEPITIDKGILNQGRYVWDIPKMIGDNFKLRVCDSEYPEICDDSDQPFSIFSPFEILSPRGDEVWSVNSDQELRWTTSGAVNKVTIQYKSQNESDSEWKSLVEGLDNEGSFLFKVPDDIASDVVFRISDYENAAVTLLIGPSVKFIEDETLASISVNPIKFVGRFDLLEPNGGEILAAGSEQRIVWDTQGTVSNVRLEYSNDNFKSDVRLIESIYGNIGSYTWVVPPDVSRATKVRVLDAKDNSVFDVSDNPFRIVAGFSLQSPNGNEAWSVGDSELIRWETNGNVRRVRLEYQTGGGENPWVILADNISNSGEYEWKVPNDISRLARVRVLNHTDLNAFDVSDNFFEIRPKLEWTVADSIHHFTVGSPVELRWETTGTVTHVRLEYSKDRFERDIRIFADEVLNEGNYVWTPPDDITESMSLRITDVSNPEVFAVTRNDFKILPGIHILNPGAPDYEEKWGVGTSQEISWNWRGALDKVKIEFSTDDFVTSTVIADKVENTGKYTWYVPDMPHAQIKIRVSDLFHSDAFSISDSILKIIPRFRVLSPDGGEALRVGSKHLVEWDTEGSISRVQLEYGTRASEDQPYAWKPIAEVSNDPGKYEWTVPSDVSQDVLIRVSDSLDQKAFDLSNIPFKIMANFEVLSPNLADILQVFSKHQIRWETKGDVPSVKLEYAASPEDVNPAQLEFHLIENFWSNSGAYYWTVPDTIFENVWIRISDAYEPESAVVSDSFRIRGSLKLKLPSRENYWPIGSNQTILWDTLGSIKRVHLDYTHDDGQTWSSVAENVPNSGRFGWKVPSDNAAETKIRIRDASNPLVYDIAERPVVITAQFNFTNPLGGEVWPVASTQTIRWATTGNVSKVWLEYLSEDTKWKKIAGPIAQEGSFEGSYDWVIPDSISSLVTLRVRDGDNPKATAVSEPVSIVGGLQLTSPHAEDFFAVEQRTELSWETTGTIPQVRIEAVSGGKKPSLNLNDYESHFVIADSVDNKGRFDWLVPDHIGSDYRILISDARDRSVASVSEEPFSIIGAVQLLRPVGGEKWKVGSEQQIAWATVGTIPTLVLEFSRDDFFHDVNLIASNVPNTGASVWVIPDVISDYIRIRISDLREGRTKAISQPIEIRSDFFFKQPEAGETLQVQSKKVLEWQNTGTVPYTRLEYSRDEFRHDVQVIENSIRNIGSYEWTVPDAVSDHLKVRVSDVSNANVFAISHPLRIQGSIHLKSFRGGEVVPALSQQKILWNTIGTVPRVRLEYSRDNFKQDIHVIASDIENQGFYDFIVPDDLGPGVKIRVVNVQNFAVSDMSPEPFTIRGTLAMTMNPKDQRWLVGSAHDLTWETKGTIPFVRVEYSKDDFQGSRITIADKLANHGKLTWTVPDDISDRVRFRVSNYLNPEVYAETRDPLAIIGNLELLTPRAGDLIRAGSMRTVKWKTTGTIPVVRLEYALLPPVDEPAPIVWKIITGSTENTGVYEWAVPDDISDRIQVRVSEVYDPEVNSTSDGVMSIVGGLKLLVPHGGERWIVGTQHEILWDSVGTTKKVNLEYSRDNFENDIVPIAADILNTGRFVWTVPDSISDHVRIRVQNSDDERVFGLSANPLAIIGELVLVSPSRPLTVTVGQEQSLEWQTVGSLPKVDLYYGIPKKDRQGFEFYKIQKRVPNQGLYSWRVPDHIAENVRIRISDSRDETVTTLSENKVKIQGKLEFTAPTEPVTWMIGEKHRLLWETTGTVPDVVLEASQDGFEQDVHVLEEIFTNENEYLWIVPDAIGSWQLRVRDLRDATVSSMTAPIKIQGSLNLLSPAGGEVFKVGQTQEIRWHKSGTIPTVRLEYSRDGFERDIHTIEGALPIAELASQHPMIYSWVIPDAISDQVEVRVSDVRDADLFSKSSLPFEIKADLTVASPQGAEIWTVGDIRSISWNVAGTVPEVDLEYSHDAFKRDVRSIAKALSNRGKFDWKVADAISPNVWIRVSDTRDASSFSVHEAPFEIRGALSFSNLSKHQVVNVGDEVLLEWKTTGTIPRVRLEYFSESDPKRRKVIEDQVPNQGSFYWRVPDDIGDDYRIRISDANHLEVQAVSEGTLKVTGAFDWVVPRGGEVWTVGDRQRFEWRTTGTVPEIILEYSDDSFNQDVRLIQTIPAQDNRFVWTVSDWIGSGQIRIRNARDASIKSLSPSIDIQGTLDLISPQGGEIFKVGEAAKIRWESNGTIPHVRMEYSTDRFQEDIRMIETSFAAQSAQEGHYVWTVPDAISDTVWVRVVDARDDRVRSQSETHFKIQPQIELTAPLGKEAWVVGSSHEVTWKTLGTVPKVHLEYSHDGFKAHKKPIVLNLSNRGTYVWDVDDAIAPKVWVRVVDARDPNAFATHESSFEIRGALSINNLKENQIVSVGEEVLVEWATTGSIPQVRLEYVSASNPIDRRVIEDRVPNQGAFYWRIPDDIGPDYQVLISDPRNALVQAVSQGVLKIEGRFDWVTPRGSETWTVGEKQRLEWKTTGTILAVALEYSEDGFEKDIRVIEETLGNDHGLVWTVPDWIGFGAFRVRDIRDSSVFSISPEVKVQGALQLLSPAGGETFNVEDVFEIRWTSNGTIPVVRLEYSQDLFDRDIHLIEPSLKLSEVQADRPEEFSYSWKVPDVVSEDLRVRVVDVSNPNVTSTTRAPLKVQPQFKMHAPRGGEVWEVGTEKRIAWETIGSVPEVRLELSNDRFKRDVRVLAGGVANSGSYTWTVKDVISSSVWIRVVDPRDESAVATHEDPLEIQGILKLKSLQQDRVVRVGEEMPLEWESIGTLPQVRLEYYSQSNRGERFVIEDHAPNQGIYYWKIPDVILNDIRIRVLDPRDPEVVDTSLGTLKIEGAFNWMAPTGVEVWTVGDRVRLEWKTTGTIPAVVMEYSEDGFEQDIRLLVQDKVLNEGRFFSNIPDWIGEGSIRIRDARDSTVFAVSPSIKIQGELDLLSPSGGDILKVGELKEIRWTTKGTIPQVRLEYSTDNFRQDIRVIETALETMTIQKNDQGVYLYYWQVPDAISDEVRVRITDVRDSNVTAQSDKLFKIRGAFRLTSPKERQVWPVGTEHKISWSTTGSIPEVRLQYSRDNFERDIQDIERAIPNKGIYLWTVGDAISPILKVRVVDASDDSVWATHEQSLEVQGVLGFDSVLDPEVWTVGEEVALKWNSQGTIPKVRLEYSQPSTEGDGRFYQVIQDQIPNRGIFYWKVPDAISDHVKLRITDSDNEAVSAITPGTVRIQGALEFTNPMDSTVWTVGDRKRVDWRTLGTIPAVILEYARDDSAQNWRPLEDFLINEDRYFWQTPDAIGPIQLRVRDAKDANILDVSPIIQIKGAITLLAPSGGEVWKVGGQQNIEWTSRGTIPVARLEYSTDHFKRDIRVIESAIETSQLQREDPTRVIYRWQVPDAISDQVQVRVSDIRDIAVQSTSTQSLKIKGGFKMVSPRGRELWLVGQEREISWLTDGTIPEVRLEYSRDGFNKDIQVIENAIANQGVYQWNVSDAIGPTVWVRVVSVSDPSTWSTHSQPFEVRGELNLVSPKGGELLKVGEEVELRWNTTGSIRDVRLEYFEPGSYEMLRVIEDRLPNEGSYRWRIPEDLPAQIKIRLTDAHDSKVFDETENPLKVHGILRFLYPTSDVFWTVGSHQELAWETRGTIPRVNIEFSRDGFKEDKTTIHGLLPNAGNAQWTVSDLMTQSGQIRISDADNPEVYAVTAAPVTVAADFDLLGPTGGENWTVGTRQKILWKNTGTVRDVVLEYSHDQFVRHREYISDKLPNNGEYIWSVPDSIHEKTWIRVSDASNPKAMTVSSLPFSISGKLWIRAPRGGEVWTVGDEREVLWNTVGTIPFIDLEYSIDNFVHSTKIQERVENKGTYLWKVPDMTFEQVQIRVSDSRDPRVYDTTDLATKIQGALHFVIPQGGEFWQVGTQHSIVWKNEGSIPFVSLEYSTDNFTTAIPVILGLDNQNRYQWTVPDIASDQVKFRLSDVRDQSVFVVSNPIRMGGALQIQSPTGGETWFVGDHQDIRWKTTGTIPRVRLEMSSDGFKNDVQTLAAAMSNTGAYRLKVPDTIRSGMQVRISDVRNPQISDVSRGFIKIAGGFSIESPQGGEVWSVGSRQVIRWKTRGTIPTVRLEYSENNFVNTVPMATNIRNTGEFAWEVPDLTGSELQFRIHDVSDPSISASTLYRVVVRGELNITSPLGGEVWTAKTPRPITWRTVGTIPNLDIVYSTDNFKTTHKIAASIPNTGSYLWTVPDITAKDVKVRIYDTTNPNIADTLPRGVNIQGEISMLSPVGGEVWVVSSEHPIRWKTTGEIRQVRLEYSLDGFRTVLPIVLNLDNTGKYLWRVPDSISKKVRVRVRSIDNPSVAAETREPLEIRGALQLVSPLGEEVWATGSRHAITWQSIGTIGQVRVDYSTDDFKNDVQAITPAFSNKGSYYWEIPAISASKIKVRVSDTSNPMVYDLSQGEVRIAGKLEMTYPGSGESFQVGKKVEIQWRSTPNISNVKLEYSTDDFETSHRISDYLPNKGAFTWNVPNVMSQNMRVRVSDANNAMVYSFSKMPFSVHGKLKLVSPRGGETWRVGNRQRIAWETLGTIPKVRLEYSWDGFKTALPIATNTPNTGHYDWTVAEVPSSEVRFRVAHATQPSIESISDEAIRVVGDLKILSPFGEDRWVVGEERLIRWQTLGFIPQVDIEYSKDNFNQDIHLIASGIPNTGSHTWKIPNDVSKYVKVRIRSAEDNSIDTLSEKPFQIDRYRVRWVVRDLAKGGHLSGLSMSDSGGKTQSDMTSPIVLEYPYGIYTTVWTKPGYQEFRTTWLADKDQTFTVNLEPQHEAIELVRVDFDYDKSRDFMKIRTWFERDGRPLPAVIQSEVRIYENGVLQKTLKSSHPDAFGHFQMVWDTSNVSGNTIYLASASITTASGTTVTSPMSFQLNIPVKEKQTLIPRDQIASDYLRPLGLSENLGAAVVLEEDEDKVPEKSSTNSRYQEKRMPKSNLEYKERRLLVPEKAILNETISIGYEGAADARPVIDIYDADRKLVIRGAALKRAETMGRYYYLLPIKGVAFIPGKSITVTVIERKTGLFKSASVLIESAPSALGWDQQVGNRTILSLLRRLDEILRQVDDAVDGKADVASMLTGVESQLSEFAFILTQEAINESVLDKLNRIAEGFAQIAGSKGFDAEFLVREPLGPGAGLADIQYKMRHFRDAIEMLKRVYQIDGKGNLQNAA